MSILKKLSQTFFLTYALIGNKNDRIGNRIRLEQERIPFATVRERIVTPGATF